MNFKSLKIECWLLLTVFALSSFAVAQEKPAKLAPPEAAAQKKTLALVTDLYQAEYEAAKTAKHKSDLAKKILTVGEESRDDSTARFVLIQLAKDIAVNAGDAELALAAVDQLEMYYEIDGLHEKGDALEKLAKATKLPEVHQSLAAIFESLRLVCLAEERFELAKSVNQSALDSARKAKSVELVKQVSAQGKQIEQIEMEFKATLVAQAKLTNEPTDPAANLQVGKYTCFIKGDWENGLLMLALSRDAKLSALAQQELAEKQDPFALGNAWWLYSQTVEEPAKSATRGRAAKWYREISAELEGLSKKVVESRLEQIGNNATNSEPEADFIDLLDRSQNKFWKPIGNPSWSTSKGVLIGQGEFSYLLFDKGPIEDFELQGEVKINSTGNSGIYFRARSQPGVKNPMGYEMQILGSAIKSDQRTGGLYNIVPINQNLIKDDVWFGVQIVAVGNRITMKIDDNTVVDFVDSSSRYRDGYFILQQHDPNTVVQFQKLRYRTLSKSSNRDLQREVSKKLTNREIAKLRFKHAPDAVRFQGHYYKVFPTQMSWDEANAECEKMGGTLPIVSDFEENSFLTQLALKEFNPPGAYDGIWLGATDAMQEGKWLWVDGKSMTYSVWSPGQPNNKQQTEHYLVLWLAKNSWVDQPKVSTEQRLYYVCEWEN